MAVVQSGRSAHPDAKTVAGNTTPGTTGVIEKSRRSVLVAGLLATLLAVGGGVPAFVVLRKKTPSTTPTTPSKKRVRWRIRSRPEGAKVVRIADGSVVGQTPLDQEAEQSTEPLRFRVELAGHLPREVQISLEASSEVQVVLHEEPPKPPPAPEVTPVEPKAKPPVKKTKRSKDSVPHIEN